MDNTTGSDRSFSIVEAMGVTVVSVPALKDSVCLVRDQRIALIRPDLDEIDREWALDWLIQQAAALELQP